MERVDFDRKVKYIAEILGYRVEFPDRDQWSGNLAHIKSLVNGEPRFGEDISLTNGGYQNGGRIRIHGWFPQAQDGSRCDYGIHKTSITVTEKKTAPQIAKDMMRRFLPDYRSNLARVIQQVKEHEASRETQASVIKALADLVGIKDVRNDQRGCPNKFYWHPGGGYIEVESTYAGTVKIELRSISAEQAERVLTALKE